MNVACYRANVALNRVAAGPRLKMSSRCWRYGTGSERSGKFHRDDVHMSLGLTIEFQHSSLSVNELTSRNYFFKNNTGSRW